MSEAAQEVRAHVQLDQQGGDRRERQHPRQLRLQLLGLAWHVLGRQRRDHQLVVLIEPDRAGVIRQRLGQGGIQVGQRGMQFLL
ncbi:hypothetical protein, partial [Streptomyces halstedii]|uniref:hypothetical protein n=1 Tax=Streptomyces halstedii TaxID=1944 RepID=UPI003359E393